MISGKKFDIDPPARAPTKLAKTRADEEPKNTARGLLDVPPVSYTHLTLPTNREV